jgi:hypothetical protein
MFGRHQSFPATRRINIIGQYGRGTRQLFISVKKLRTFNLEDTFDSASKKQWVEAGLPGIELEGNGQETGHLQMCILNPQSKISASIIISAPISILFVLFLLTFH